MRSTDGAVWLLVLLVAACQPPAPAKSAPAAKAEAVAYACKSGGGPMDGLSCDGKIGERIDLRIPEAAEGPMLTYRPFGSPDPSIIIPPRGLSPIRGPDGAVRTEAMSRAHVVEAGESERFLVVRLSDDTWRLVERPAPGAGPDAVKVLTEGPFTRAELEERLAGAPMPGLTSTVRLR